MNESTQKQLQIAVEKVVRPVRAGWDRKDRIREELMAHVTGIFEDEFARLGDEAAATQKAVVRFGDPAKLTDELNASRTLDDRVAYSMERVFGWRPPESAARYILRLTLLIFVTMMVSLALPITVGKIVVQPWSGVRGVSSVWLIPSIICGAIFPLGWLYFRIRDAMFGFCSPRSWLRVACYGVLFAIVFFAFGLASAALGSWSWTEGWSLMTPQWLIVSVLAPIGSIALARYRGPAEIRHTEWSLLQID